MSQVFPRSTPATTGGSRDALRVLGVVVWSMVVWVALWGTLSLANLLWGAVLGVATLRIRPVRHRDHRLPVRLVPMARFGALFLTQLVKASAIVAWEVVTPRNDINEGIVAIPLRTTSPGMITLIGNATSLTPGTLTLEVRRDPATLYVHVLHLRDIEDVREDIHRLERVALRAFGEDPDPPPTDPVGGARP